MPEPTQFNPENAGRFSFRTLLPSLVMDVILPIAAFNVLVSLGVSTLAALVTGGVFPAISIAQGYLKSRQIEPLGIIVVAFLAVGTATSLITGSVFFAVVKDSFLTAAFGLLCLGSLLAARPLAFYLIRQFVAGHDPAMNEWWNGLWEFPHFRRMNRVVTIVWGLVFIAEAALRVLMALVVSPAMVVTISPVLAFAVGIGITLWTRAYLIAARKRRMAELARQKSSEPQGPSVGPQSTGQSA
jgi:hypothetical protein